MLKSRRCDIGRYINGDIEHKFHFAVQRSDAADRFGVTGVQPEELYYYFSDSDLQEVKDEIKRIENSLGSKLAKLDEFYHTDKYYAEDDLCQLLSIDHSQVKNIMSEYADLELGRKIRDCVEKNGECEFIAEL